MRVTATLGFVLVAAFAKPAFGQSFLGEWTATATTAGGEVSETLTVVETDDGYAITAKLVGAPEGAPTAGSGEEIVLDGDSFTYKRTLTMGGSTIVFTYTGVVAGDTFTGTVEMSTFAGQIPYNGVRIRGGN